METADREALGAATNYTVGVTKEDCKSWCRDDTQCVSAMYQKEQVSGRCFIYDKKPTIATTAKSESSVFTKESSTGELIRSLEHVHVHS